MSKISAFLFTTLNGYYKGLKEDISWHNHGEEELRFSEESVSQGHTLLFGRITYEHMYEFWPSTEAIKSMPIIAAGMNDSPKLVVSKSLKKAAWNNTTILGYDWLDQLGEMKKTTNITLLGSGTILTQLADNLLLDELQIMLDPTVIGAGATLFQGAKHPHSFRLVSQQVYQTGNILLTYKA